MSANNYTLKAAVKSVKQCGVITLLGMNNYGNRLQNYAVLELLDKLGYQGINFYNKKRVSFIYRNFRKLLRGDFKSVKRAMIFKSLDKKVTRNLYTFENIPPINRRMDYFLLGSDQIWNPKFAATPHLFGAFAPDEKLIAYSASFGTDFLPDNRREEFAKYLNRIKHISVREAAGARIVRELTGRDAEVLIDPTMMLDRSDWERFMKKPQYPTPKRFILTYFLGELSTEKQQYIDYVRKEFGYLVIKLSHKQPNNYWYKTGPAEFLWLIEHAALVLTDSFHGAVFSVLMDSPFLVFRRNDPVVDMSSRIDTLLDTLHLQERLFDSQQGDEIFKKPYSHIPEILENERSRTIKFLKNAMDLE